MHVPFCFHKCHYCDFYSIVPAAREADQRQQDFADALLREVDAAQQPAALRPRTIFIGGGTPTLLKAELWQRLLQRFDDLGLLQNTIEFTIEANPETVNEELAQLLARGGVNRVSIGAQSFDLRHLKTLERWHDPASVGRAVQRFRDAGIHNINLDLIFAIPGQTLDDLDRDLDAALAMAPEHLSCYSLIFEPGTALAQKRQMGRIALADESIERSMYERVMQRLSDAGFEHYEVSNWARPGRRCQHNLAYWHNLNWLGFGPAAASHVGGWRWKNRPNLGQYVAGSPQPPVQDVERLNDDDTTGEQLMLRLRLIDGVPLAWLVEHVPDNSVRAVELDHLIAIGMLERTPTHLRLTRAGLLVADSVIARLL